MLEKKKEISPEEFWGNVEKEMGVPVREKGLCRFLETPFDSEHPFWGLIAVFDHGVRIFTFKNQSWISALMNYQAADPVDEFVSSEDILELSLSKRNLWEKIISTPRIITIELGTYDHPRLVLEPDRDAEKIFEAILLLAGKGK